MKLGKLRDLSIIGLVLDLRLQHQFAMAPGIWPFMQSSEPTMALTVDDCILIPQKPRLFAKQKNWGPHTLLVRQLGCMEVIWEACGNKGSTIRGSISHV